MGSSALALISVMLMAMIPTSAALTLQEAKKHSQNDRDLVFMHVPYNFGHTIEMARLLPASQFNAIGNLVKEGTAGDTLQATGGNVMPMLDKMLSPAAQSLFKLEKPDGEGWGHFSTVLGKEISEVTGCSMYFTPQKYWPRDLAEKYFGDKKVFGVLRDPYERLIAMFRGNFKDYGGGYDEFFKTCDVNGAIKTMMKSVLDSKEPFMSQCSFLPQAEYFEGPYGITLPIDNRRFPDSMNEAFTAHGYEEHIPTDSILHVNGCNNVWAGDLDAEAKALVRKVYAKDFELLCKHFGYCDTEENVCLQGVYNMCPEKAFAWNSTMAAYVKRT